MRSAVLKIKPITMLLTDLVLFLNSSTSSFFQYSVEEGCKYSRPKENSGTMPVHANTGDFWM